MYLPISIRVRLHIDGLFNMAGASDKARFYLEQSVPEMQDLIRRKIFTEVSIVALKYFDRTAYPKIGRNPLDSQEAISFRAQTERTRFKCFRLRSLCRIRDKPRCIAPKKVEAVRHQSEQLYWPASNFLHPGSCNQEVSWRHSSVVAILDLC